MVMSSFDFFGTDKVGTKIGFITPKKKKIANDFSSLRF